MLKFLSSTKFLIAIIILSALTIFVGFDFVKYQEAQYESHLAQEAAATALAASEDILTEEQQLNLIAEEAETLLKETLSAHQGPVALEISNERKLEIEEKYKANLPEIGTDEWCDYMMIKPNQDWTDQDKGNFAKNCI